MQLTLDEALQKAVEAHKANKIQEADRLYTSILQTQPKHPDANHNMGVLAVSVGKVQEALPFFKTALKANTSVGQFWVSYIDALIKSGQIVDAETVLAEAKDKRIKGEVLDQLEQKLSAQNGATVNAGIDNRDHDQTRINILDSLKLDQALRLAKKKVKEESPEDAKRIYDDILARFPKNKKAIDGIESLSAGFIGKSPKVQDPPPEQLQSIINLYSQGQLQQALSDASQMQEKFPNSTVLYNIAGACNAGLMKFDAAIVSYKKALKINPDNAEVNNNMGNAFKSIGDLETAVGSFKQAVKIKPDYAEAYYNMGNTLHKMGDVESALVSYNGAVKINPDFAEAHYRIGEVLNDQGDFDAAINSYKVAIKLKPDYAEAYIDMGNALNDQGNLEASIDSYKRAIKIKPDYAEAYYNMGLVLYSKGNLDSAIDSYKQALQIKPDNAEVYINMGNALKDKDDLEASIDSYKQALKIKPDFAKALSNLAQVLKSNFQYKEAKECFDKLTDKESVGKGLECTYHLKNYGEFNEQLDVIAKKDPANIRVAAISNFAAYSNRQKDSYPFCEKPIELIKLSHIKNHVADADKFINTILHEMNGKNASWEPKTKTTKSGYQTSGNLFAEPSAAMNTLGNIIRKELHLFYSTFKTRDSILIENWPEEYSLQGWYVRMLQNGHQGSHIHPAGWVSGVFYLKTVEAPTQNEGAIEFGVPGDDYPVTNEDLPYQIYQPCNGDLILFPSSLFHKTIPVIKDVERCVIAFDLIIGGRGRNLINLTTH